MGPNFGFGDCYFECQKSHYIACGPHFGYISAKILVFHNRSKHFAMEYHFVCKVIKNKEVGIFYIPLQEMVAAPMTKPLLRDICFITCKKHGVEINVIRY